MKRVLIGLIILGVLSSVVSCTKKETIKNTQEKEITIEDNEKNVEAVSKKDNQELEAEDKLETEYYEIGESVEVTDERGTYYFSIVEAKILPPKEDCRDSVLQISWEVKNKDFNGWEKDASGNVIDEGFVCVDYLSLKVKDGNNYVLPPMSSGWDGDWISEVKLYHGENGIFSHTFIINDTSKLDYVYVDFVRLDKEFRVNVTQ